MSLIKMLKYKHPCLVLVVFSLLPMLKAASIHFTSALPSITSTSPNPPSLVLPAGFDSELPPRQPMLYPFVVPTTSTLPTPALTPAAVMKKSLGPFITPGWVPISSSSNTNIYRDLFTRSPLAGALSTLGNRPTQSYPVPILEDRSSKYILSTNDNGPVFESIVYGTWKPDPPLQPVEMLNATTTAKYNSNNIFMNSATTTSTSKSVKHTSDSTSSNHHGSRSSSSKIDGKVTNKTIHRQHGGFIDNKQQQQQISDFENRSYPRGSHELAALVQRPQESTVLMNKNEPKPHKFNKKQGRQKIRPISSGKTAKTTASTAASTTSLMTSMTTPIESTEQSATTNSIVPLNDDIAKFSANSQAEVLRQINDSIEIKYNHKQTSRHSIEVTAHEHYKNHRLHDANDDEQIIEQAEIDIVTAPTTLPDSQSQEATDYEDDGGSSVIRMNWPTDFMNAPISSSSTTSTEHQPLDMFDKGLRPTTPSMDSELPLALSSLNIPPSLWPKFPGNITKLGLPFAVESSLEEPAMCVPITVQEHNMINSHEIVNIERVFCFPMPITKLSKLPKKPRGFSKPTTQSTNLSPDLEENIENFADFYDITLRNRSNLLKSDVTLAYCCIVAVYFKFMY